MLNSREKHGVIFALLRNGRIRLEKRMEPEGKFFGFTLIPGGAVEGNESMSDAVIREVREERGVQVTKAKYLGPIVSTEPNGIRNIRHVWVVTDWKGKLRNPEHNNRMVTVPLKKARRLCTHPVSQQILMKVFAWSHTYSDQ